MQRFSAYVPNLGWRAAIFRLMRIYPSESLGSVVALNNRQDFSGVARNDQSGCRGSKAANYLT